MRNVRIGVVALLALLVPGGLVVLSRTAGATTSSTNFTVLLTTRANGVADKDPASKSPASAPTSTLSLTEGNGSTVRCTSPRANVVKYTTYEMVNYSCTTPTKISASYELSIVGNPAREYATAGRFDSECFTTYTTSTLNESPYVYTTQKWICSAPQHPTPSTPPKK